MTRKGPSTFRRQSSRKHGSNCGQRGQSGLYIQNAKLLATSASHASRRARAAPALAQLHERLALLRYCAHPVSSTPVSLTRPRYFGFVFQECIFPTPSERERKTLTQPIPYVSLKKAPMARPGAATGAPSRAQPSGLHGSRSRLSLLVSKKSQSNAILSGAQLSLRKDSLIREQT
jgi:hypothetical protein